MQKQNWEREKNPISEGETFFKTHKQEENITTKKATEMNAEEIDVRGTNTVVMGEWVGKGEKPGGMRGTKLELVGGIVATQGGERLGLRLK